MPLHSSGPSSPVEDRLIIMTEVFLEKFETEFFSNTFEKFGAVLLNSHFFYLILRQK